MNIIHCDYTIILIINRRFCSHRFDIIILYFSMYKCISIVENYWINYNVYKSYIPNYE